MKKEIVYEIIDFDEDCCELWSVVETNFGGSAKNYVCRGTREYCERIKERLENSTLGSPS